MSRTADNTGILPRHEPHARVRTDSYVLLAALLTGPPTEALLQVVRDLDWDENLSERMRGALDALIMAVRRCARESIGEEFQRLFVGLGSGELVPYASWYREKMIQSAPLAAIRADLGRLGIVRQSGTFESEDHAGALCEIMALLSKPENDIADGSQAVFFSRHINPWLKDFFRDLQAAEDAVFYSAVGRFALCFLEEEDEFLHSFHGGAERKAAGRLEKR